jgi:NitT/TauT family transport system ATP-binding protein
MNAPAVLSPELLVNRVEKTYPDGTRALDETRIEVQRGDFVSLLGPSGCGKSTLLKLCAGLEQPSAGQLRWRGAATPAGGGQRLAMVFQEATLMPWATVAANVRLPLDLQGLTRATADARVAQALAQVGLAGFDRHYPRQLSGGMQMRVSIARALATEPELLLMDEPFGALDEFTRHKLDTDLRALWQARGLTVVFVTHSIYEAVFLSTRVVMMAARPGRVVADVAITETVRDDEFRLSPAFSGYCRALSGRLQAVSSPAPH